jgi:8-oxo-dGTP diphosphatase
VLDHPNRDDHGWVISAAHADAVPSAHLDNFEADSARLLPIAQAKGLAFDHNLIVAIAVNALRADYEIRPNPEGLLTGPFALLQLQRLHEAVAGHDLPKDTFRRRMQDQLQETGDPSDGIVGKPARPWLRGSQL